jgi:hypothetical protein
MSSSGRSPRIPLGLQRRLLSIPGGTFSIKKFYAELQAEGLASGKDVLHEFLGYLEDCYLIRTVTLHARSLKRRMVNPRRVFPIDPAWSQGCSRRRVLIRQARRSRPPSCSSSSAADARWGT